MSGVFTLKYRNGGANNLPIRYVSIGEKTWNSHEWINISIVTASMCSQLFDIVLQQI